MNRPPIPHASGKQRTYSPLITSSQMRIIVDVIELGGAAACDTREVESIYDGWQRACMTRCKFEAPNPSTPLCREPAAQTESPGLTLTLQGSSR